MTGAFAAPALAEESTYPARLSRHIARFRLYPAAALTLSIQGTAKVGFTVTRDGKLLGPRIVESSGDEDLDHAALESLKKAEPLPVAPASVKDDELDFVLPVVYRLSQSALTSAADIDVAAFMSGKCSSTSLGEHLDCKHAVYALTRNGRVSFRIVLEDREKARQAVVFAGAEASKPQGDTYQVSIDQIRLYLKALPKPEGTVDNPVKAVTGTCKQIGDFSRRKLSRLSCSASEEGGQVYAVEFESDGSPIKVKSERDERLAPPAKPQ